MYQGIAAVAGASTTVISVPMAATDTASLASIPGGWTFAMTPASQHDSSKLPRRLMEQAKFKIDNPGSVVSIIDPSTGQLLLVGTVREPAALRYQPESMQRTPEFSVVPTWLGVAVEPFSDHASLRVTSEGFSISSQLAGAAGQAPYDVRVRSALEVGLSEADLSRPSVLAHRLNAQITSSAAAPPRARSGPRFAVAQNLALMGFGVEAQAVLALLAMDDPAYALQADFVGLSGISAILAGRLSEASGIDDPRLNQTDEARLWRGIRDVGQGLDTAAIRDLSNLLPLVLTYPTELQRRLLPVIVEVAVKQGRPDAGISTIPNATNDLRYAYALALQLESAGEVDAALTAFDTLSQSRDQLLQTKASVQSAELRFASGRVDAANTALMLKKQLFRWRGDEREVALKLRVAELQMIAGLWRPSLESLRDAQGSTPLSAGSSLSASIHRRVVNVFRAMLASESQSPSPIDFVSLTAEFAEPFLEASERFAVNSLLVEKLISLDLIVPAGVMARSVVSTMPSGPERAELGARFAEMMLDNEDSGAAQMILVRSEAEGLPQEVAKRRLMLSARAQSSQSQSSKKVSNPPTLQTSLAN